MPHRVPHKAPQEGFPTVADVGFFVLRTPLLPLDELVNWGEGLKARQLWASGADSGSTEQAWEADVHLLRTRLRETVDRPAVVQALFVASPSLHGGIDHWKRDPNSKKGLQAERAMVRYFARMCGRSTPFGLFSGCSVGQVLSDYGKAHTVLSLESQAQYRCVSRLDFDYLFALTTSLQQSASSMAQLRFWPNSSLYQTSDVYYYVESRLAGSNRTHHSVRLDSDQFLDAVLDRARAGATVSDLAASVLALPGGPDVSNEEAREYVQELIANDVLVSNLVPRVTGDPLDEIIAQVASIEPLKEVAATLEAARDGLLALDKKGVGGPSPNDYRALAATLETLPAKVSLTRLFQVDMMKPVQSAILTRDVVHELIAGIEALCRLSTASEPEPLRLFREGFTARYDRASVPLLEAVDEELGIGFDQSGNDSSPLLRGMRFGDKSDGSQGVFESTHAILLRKLVQWARDGESELQLATSDLASESAARFLPSSFAVNATLAASSSEALQRGVFDIRLKAVVGPNGARLFGRFCHADPDLERHVRGYLRNEEAQETGDPEALFAEIVHLPEGRIGNVLCRPVLRDYELVYLGRSGAPQHQQIPASDLLVSVEDGHIALHSRRLGRRIIPRLTNAHGFLDRSLPPLYRFLCRLQNQHAVSVPNFSWGPLEVVDYLPRVRIGRVILAPARWRVTKDEIDRLGSPKGAQRFAAFQELRRERALPRWVVLEEDDNTLPVDLDNALSIDAVAHVLKRGSQATLREMYPTPEQLCVTGPEGRFCHELQVPFVRRAGSGQPNPMSRSPDLTLARTARALAPGSDWLYVKVYAGAAALDDILTAASPLVRAALASGAATRWFFVRYADPQRHLRIRFNGQPDRLRQEVLPSITELLNPLLAAGKIWKVQFDTYDREIERYGGLDALLAAEDIFFADSEATLEILNELDGDQGLDQRWRTALLGIDMMLTDFGLDLEGRTATMGRSRDALQRDTPAKVQLGRALGDRFRTVRKRAEDALCTSPGKSLEPDPIMAVARTAFQRRAPKVSEAVGRLRAIQERGELHVEFSSLIYSHVHMHVNRLVRSAARHHELVLYDVLFRLYDAQRAREKACARTGK